MVETRLFDLREDNDLYQKDIAKIIGINRRTYSSWETNAKIIPLKHLNSLCNYYNCSMDYVMHISNKKCNNNIIKKTYLNKKEIGENIKTIRKNNNLTLRDLAKVLNTTSSTISAYETGKTLIITAFAYQICKTYNISFDWLCARIK